MDARERLIVALDGDWELDELIRTAGAFSRTAGMVKLGNRPFTRHGPEAIRRIERSGTGVFLDLKFFDIPNTVANACREAVHAGSAMINVHALGGAEMMRRAREAVDDAWDGTGKRPLLIAVTILTSFDDAQLAEVGIASTMAEEVKRLAALAHACGLDGVVASPMEIDLIRETCGNDFLIVTPGIRPKEDMGKDDQKRVLTPGEAVRRGADYIVIGRPIIQAPNPIAAAQAIVREMEAV